MTASARRFALRARTAEAHAALDASVGPFDSVAAYRRYLRGIHAFRAPVERALVDLPGVPLPITALIEADMTAASVAPVLARDFDLPGDPSALAGILYVLQGSALGARVLYPRARALGQASAHLAAQAGDRPAWAAFCARLDAVEPFDAEAAAGGALATFGFALDAFRHAGDG